MFKTTANKITVLRIVLIPVWLILAYRGLAVPALFVYAVACLSDMLDGYIARHYNQVTNFGKFMDPLADKLLVCSTLVCAVALGRAPAWAVIIIIAREFAISGFRLIAVERGVVIAAGKSGKIKTTLQNIWCMGMLIPVAAEWWRILTLIVMILAVILTVYSFLEYLFQNRHVLKG